MIGMNCLYFDYTWLNLYYEIGFEDGSCDRGSTSDYTVPATS